MQIKSWEVIGQQFGSSAQLHSSGLKSDSGQHLLPDYMVLSYLPGFLTLSILTEFQSHGVVNSHSRVVSILQTVDLNSLGELDYIYLIKSCSQSNRG